MIAEAGLVAFLRTLLIIVCVFYGIRLLIRFVFPWIIRSLLKKRMGAFYQNAPYQETSSKKEGDVSIKTNGKRSGNKDEKDQLGDYVNFEEVEDK